MEFSNYSVIFPGYISEVSWSDGKSLKLKVTKVGDLFLY
jgi:hypothetical protein